MKSLIKLKETIKNNKNINYVSYDIPKSSNKNAKFKFEVNADVKYYVNNPLINYIIHHSKDQKGFVAFKTAKDKKVKQYNINPAQSPKFIAYSKSTRTEHIDHRARVDEDSNTLSTGDGCSNMSTQTFVHDNQGVRKLTPSECEQLQGYPVGYTKYGQSADGKKYLLSDNQRYKLCGNGISSPVSKTIIENFVKEPVKVFSTFSGCGGSELLLDKRFDVISHSEFDKFASDVLRYHYPNVPNLGDITKINAKKIQDFDLFIGGFPCQSWSISGLRKGFDDEEKGQLIYDVFRILRVKKPKYVVLENVKGLLNHNKGLSFEAILEGICLLGYAVDYELVNSINFGLMQNRERVFILAKRLD